MRLLNRDKKILIVGLGLIGGSYAQGLKRIGYEVGALARRQETIDYALEHKLIDHGSIEIDKDYVSSFDIIIFALYPKVFIQWIEKYQDYFKAGAIISDVTGVKRNLVSKIQSILREDLEFVPAHPMAGREVYGVENSDSRIFHGSNFIITPSDKNSQEAINTIKDLALLLGFKNISVISPEVHDEMIGFLSQLTHCIAVSLMTCKDSDKLVEYTGDSFRDLTRIARINENMWTELFIENKDELLSQMELFSKKFEELKTALKDEDIETMKKIMILSTQRRAQFDK